jgi:phosphohistidine phosphatase
MTRHLLMLRHAETEAARPGRRDIERQLTATGLAQAAAVGHWLNGRYSIEAVLCSPATRTPETLAELGVGAPATFPEWLYNAGGDDILAGIRELGATVQTALVVGHAPGVPAVVHDLIDAEASAAAAVATIESRFPAGTIAVLRVEEDWADLSWAALIEVRLGSDH